MIAVGVASQGANGPWFIIAIPQMHRVTGTPYFDRVEDATAFAKGYQVGLNMRKRGVDNIVSYT